MNRELKAEIDLVIAHLQETKILLDVKDPETRKSVSAKILEQSKKLEKISKMTVQ